MEHKDPSERHSSCFTFKTPSQLKDDLTESSFALKPALQPLCSPHVQSLSCFEVEETAEVEW